MYKYKQYLKIFIFSSTFIILFNFIIWNMYTKKVFIQDKIVGDLARMSYQINLIDERENISFLSKKHINYNQWNGREIDIITLGDSFSNAGAGGINPYYQDYLSSILNFDVINIQATKYGFIETILGLKTSGILDRMNPKFIILQSVERSSISRYSKSIDFNLDINYKYMEKKNSSTANLLGKVLSQKATTPIQENKNGIIKPIEKTFLLSLPETKLQQLKQMALDKKTSVRNLINSAIDEKFFKEERK